MWEFDLNIWAVLAAGVLYFAIGALWYSPLLFATPWMKLIGKTKEDLEGSNKGIYLVTLLLQILLAFVLAHFIQLASASTLAEAVQTGLWAWLGFTGVTALINNLYSGRSLRLFAIDRGYHLVGILVMSVVLQIWN